MEEACSAPCCCCCGCCDCSGGGGIRPVPMPTLIGGLGGNPPPSPSDLAIRGDPVLPPAPTNAGGAVSALRNDGELTGCSDAFDVFAGLSAVPGSTARDDDSGSSGPFAVPLLASSIALLLLLTLPSSDDTAVAVAKTSDGDDAAVAAAVPASSCSLLIRGTASACTPPSPAPFFRAKFRRVGVAQVSIGTLC